MSGKKHVFKMVPGKSLVISEGMTCYPGKNVCLGTSFSGRDNADVSRPYKIAKLAFIPLNDKSEEVLTLNVNFCQFHNGMYTCLNESGQSLNANNWYNRDATNNSLIYLNDQLVNVVTSVGDNSERYSSVDFLAQAVSYQYVTRDESGKYYFSDKKGNIIDSPYNTALQKNVAPCNAGEIKEIVNNMLLDIPIQLQKIIFELNSNQLQILAQNLTNEQLQKIIPELNSNQLQVLAENLMDEQLQALVDHLTNHQLKTLAQELNPEKLQIIVPLLDKNQLTNLVKDLNLDQVKEIFPHLKMNQFLEAIKTISNDQFVELIKDADEKILNTLFDEALKDRLPILVHNLEGDRLHDLINKLDHKKLAIVARDLTDPNKIQIIIKSLVDNPDKLQAFARNMSNEQFKELLDNIGAEELKDIIHKLPYEKVTAVIGDLSNQDQSKAIIDALDALKEKFDEQNKKQEEMKEKLEELKELLEGDDIVNPNQFSYQHSSVVNEEYYLNSNDAYTVQDYSISV
ncbi:MgtE intracellular N domain protein [Wolbachia endosymbiont (group A) of Sphaerophoria taeniata]|uniref:MgtE intracellular N domain protein n=1 Tax=Wolbachia endosymbiont (group A) of Sphaerophoria taeniata TaxID=2954057 RepID=UPI0022277465|nr:MgtE intracellular N domain protein [Wolbachia endosymbiont (group A) of Sphaerophoria taeniata]